MTSFTRGKLGLMACEAGKPFAQKVVTHIQRIMQTEGNPKKEQILSQLQKIEKQKGSKDHFLVEPLKIIIKELVEESEHPEEIHLKQTREMRFSNTEVKTEILETVRNQDIFIIQDVENKTDGKSVNDNLVALKTAVEAARRSDARYITVVVPVFPYARQDKRKTREGVTAAMVARELERVGVNRVITLDIHNEAITGFFRKTNLENLRASRGILNYVAKNKISNMVVVSPDAGAVPRNEYYANKLKTELNMIYKKRDYSTGNKVEKMILLGNVKGKNVLLVDDMIDTAGTLLEAARLLKESGAKDVYFATSLPLFNGPAIERIDAAFKKKLITKVIGTNAVYHGPDFAKKHPWYEEIDLSEYFAQVIYTMHKGKSISTLLD